MPLLLRIWAEHVVQNAEGENATKWEGQSNILFNSQLETTLFKLDRLFFFTLNSTVPQPRQTLILKLLVNIYTWKCDVNVNGFRQTRPFNTIHFPVLLLSIFQVTWLC